MDINAMWRKKRLKWSNTVFHIKHANKWQTTFATLMVQPRVCM